MKKRKARELLSKTVTVGASAIVLWGSASFIDVNMHNLGDGKIAEWNCFNMLETKAGDKAAFAGGQKGTERSSLEEQRKAEKLRADIDAFQLKQQREAERKFRMQKERTRARHARIEAVMSATSIPDEYVRVAFIEAEEENISPEMVVAVIERESGGDPNQVGQAGEIGLMQIIPWYHEEETESLGVTDLSDPRQNIQTGVKIFANLFEEHGEAYDVLMAYNMRYKGLELAANGQYSDYAKGIMSRTMELEGVSR